MVEKLLRVVATLNNVEVKGEENISRLLACIQTLKEIAEEEAHEASNK